MPHRAKMRAPCLGSAFVWILYVAAALPASPACTPMDDAARSRAIEQAREILGLPLNASFRISREAVDPNACWAQLNVEALLPGTTLRRVLFLSPDRAFLTGTVYDTQVSPPKPMLIAPSAPSGFLRTPPTPRPPATVNAVLVAYSRPSEISLRNGSASVFAQLAAGAVAPGSRLHPAGAISIEPPVAEPTGIRLVSTSGYTSRPMPVPPVGFSPLVEFKIRTTPDNAIAGVVRVAVHAYSYPPVEEGGCLRLIRAPERIVTIRVRPQ